MKGTSVFLKNHSLTIQSQVMAMRGGDFPMSGIWVCTTDQGRIFTSKNPEQAPNVGPSPEQALIFKVSLQNRIVFWTIWSQTPRIPVTFLENDQSNPSFLSFYACLLSKDIECVPVTQLLSVNCTATNLCCLFYLLGRGGGGGKLSPKSFTERKNYSYFK